MLAYTGQHQEKGRGGRGERVKVSYLMLSDKSQLCKMSSCNVGWRWPWKHTIQGILLWAWAGACSSDNVCENFHLVRVGSVWRGAWTCGLSLLTLEQGPGWSSEALARLQNSAVIQENDLLVWTCHSCKMSAHQSTAGLGTCTVNYSYLPPS